MRYLILQLLSIENRPMLINYPGPTINIGRPVFFIIQPLFIVQSIKYYIHIIFRPNPHRYVRQGLDFEVHLRFKYPVWAP